MGAHRPTLSVDRTPPRTKQNHSSADQHTVRQVAAVGKVARTFIDQISGKSRADRTGLADLIGWVRDGDTVRVASMDRLARSTVDLAQIVAELTAKKVAVEFVKERLTFRADADDPFATISGFARLQPPTWQESPSLAGMTHRDLPRRWARDRMHPVHQILWGLLQGAADVRIRIVDVGRVEQRPEARGTTLHTRDHRAIPARLSLPSGIRGQPVHCWHQSADGLQFPNSRWQNSTVAASSLRVGGKTLHLCQRELRFDRSSHGRNVLRR